MKPATFFLALLFPVLIRPCTAQTSPVQNKATSETMQALAKQLFRTSSGVHHRRLTPQEKAHSEAVLAHLNEMDRAGFEALQAKDFVAAEDFFRESIETCPQPDNYFHLGEALSGQKRIPEAIAAYRAGVYKRHPDGMPYTIAAFMNEAGKNAPYDPNAQICPGNIATMYWMQYALLLSQTGQGAEAAVIYQKALPDVPDVRGDDGAALLEAATPSPEALQAAAHVSVGLCATFFTNHDDAMREFDKAQRLQPDSALTNYFYAYGWKNLTPAERGKYGTEQQAKAALLKAIRLGKGEVKKAAQKALMVAMKPK